MDQSMLTQNSIQISEKKNNSSIFEFLEKSNTSFATDINNPTSNLDKK